MGHDISHLGLLEDEAIVLDTAALEIALLDHAEVEAEPYTDLLALIAESILRLGASALTSAQRAEVLAGVMSEGFAFEGDRDTYDRPDNADLIRVIDRRRGLPVALTILYVAAARRVGWEAVALNTPGHVLARVGGDTDPVLIDPFNKGAVVDSDSLGALLSGIFGHPVVPSAEHLSPMSNRAVLVRLLMNQATRAEGEGRRDRARLEMAEGRRQDARSSLSAMLELTRNQALRANIHAALDAIARLGD